MVMEDFFGCSLSHDASSSAPRQQQQQQAPLERSRGRIVRRNVWSCDLHEEDGWIDALLSLVALSSSQRIMSSHHDSSLDHETAEDQRRVADNDYDLAAINDTAQREDGIPNNMPNTEIPKIIHFIWLGGDERSIPTFPFLNAENSTSCDSKRDGKENHDIDVVMEDTTQERLLDSKSLRWNECMLSWAKHHSTSRGWIIQLWTEKHIVSHVNLPPHCHYDSVNGKEHRNAQPMAPSFQLDAAAMHNYEGYLYAMKHGHYGMASDILRLEILNKFGGIYVDVDYWCIDSFDDLLSRVNARPVQFFCGASNTGCIELNNGLLACRRKGHPIVWNMMNSIHSYFKERLSGVAPSPSLLFSQGTQHDSMTMLISSFFDAATTNIVESMRQQAGGNKMSSMEVIEQTGPGLLTRSACRWIVKNDGETVRQTKEEGFPVSQVVIFRSNVFHPFPNNELLSNSSNVNKSIMSSSLRKLVSFLTTETKAVHLWGCSWQQGCIDI